MASEDEIMTTRPRPRPCREGLPSLAIAELQQGSVTWCRDAWAGSRQQDSGTLSSKGFTAQVRLLCDLHSWENQLFHQAGSDCLCEGENGGCACVGVSVCVALWPGWERFEEGECRAGPRPGPRPAGSSVSGRYP